MKKKLLLKACEDIIKTFNPKVMTLDSHAEAALGDVDGSALPALRNHARDKMEADANCVFIKQVFYGCVRNKEALKVRPSC